MDMNLNKLREIVKDRGAWGATVNGVAKSRTWLNNNAPAFIPWCMCWWEWRLGHFQREMNFWQYVEMHVCIHHLIPTSRKGSHLVHFFNTFLLSIDSVQKKHLRDVPGSPVIKTPLSNAEGMGSIPGWRSKAPHASGCGQKFRKKDIWQHRIPIPEKSS